MIYFDDDTKNTMFRLDYWKLMMRRFKKVESREDSNGSILVFI